MKDFSGTDRLPSGDESIAPVTIFDGEGRVVRVVAGTEFRRIHGTVPTARHPVAALRRQRRGDG